MRSVMLLVLYAAIAPPATAQTPSFETRFAGWRGHRDVLHALFKDMPLGGDLHSHLSGALTPSELIVIAQRHDYEAAFTDAGDFLGFVLPGRGSPNAARLTNFQAACNVGAMRQGSGVTKVACKRVQDITTTERSRIVDALVIDANDTDRTESRNFQAFIDIFDRTDDLTDNTDVMPELVHVVMDNASTLRVSYVELKLTPYGRANTQRQNVKTEDLLSVLRDEVTAKNRALRRQSRDTVVVKLIAQLQRTRPERAGGVNDLPYIRCSVGSCTSRWEQAHYLTTASRFSDFVVGYDFVQLPEVPLALSGGRTARQEMNRLTALYGDANITRHAGESTRSIYAGNIHLAVEAGADRIGHAFNLTNASAQSKASVCTGDVPIEVSLSSNVRLQLAATVGQHPAEKFIDGSVCSPTTALPVTLNTDDAGIFQTDLAREFCIATANFGLSWSQVKRIARRSLEVSFASSTEKAGLLRSLDAAIADFESNWSPPTTLPSPCANPT